MTTCPLCDQVDNRFVIRDGKLTFALLDLNPINQYHTLIVPKRHFQSFVDLPDDVASEVFLMARAISKIIREVVKPDAISHLSDDDIAGGFNSVGHYKFHIIPRFADDLVTIDWNRSEPPTAEERLQWALQLKGGAAKS